MFLRRSLQNRQHSLGLRARNKEEAVFTEKVPSLTIGFRFRFMSKGWMLRVGVRVGVVRLRSDGQCFELRLGVRVWVRVWIKVRVRFNCSVRIWLQF